MERAEAFKTLRLDASADVALVESAYWELVRQAQQNADVAAGRDEIERLNEARSVLAPAGPSTASSRRAERRAEASASGDAGLQWLETIADWVWNQALRARTRWPGRGPEIGLIAGAGLVLMVLALGSGASVLLTFAAAGALLVAIWAPWRRMG